MTVHEPLTEDEKTAWIEALRSGEYQQGEHLLKTEYKVEEGAFHNGFVYCCLGVLGELVGFDDLKEAYLCKRDAENEAPTFLKLPKLVQLALAWNNDEGYSFNDIADYLESVSVEELHSATECLPPQAGVSL